MAGRIHTDARNGEREGRCTDFHGRLTGPSCLFSFRYKRPMRAASCEREEQFYSQQSLTRRIYFQFFLVRLFAGHLPTGKEQTGNVNV